jgi:2-furoyl-CoA dehydrogenase 2Fe-2S iron sulfur subunit
VRIAVEVNGVERSGEVEPRTLLSDFLRHDLGLTGTHVGCEHGVCGACTVQVDGEPARACLMFAVQAQGHSVRTIEGLAGPDGELHPLQRAFHERHALQCGFCTAGILMSLDDWLAKNPDPDERSLREMLSGHLCRCTGYTGIVRAALEAAAEMRHGEEMEAAPRV